MNHPWRLHEASGTSGMKAVLAGVLNLSVLDGWWDEMEDGVNGFNIGDRSPNQQPSDTCEQAFYQLAHVIRPLFYARNAEGLPEGWLERVRWAFTTLAWRVNFVRTMKDYVLDMYVQAHIATEVAQRAAA
jgi:starch phosphorylase